MQEEEIRTVEELLKGDGDNLNTVEVQKEPDVHDFDTLSNEIDKELH